jgi:hypothetical protein
MAEVSLRNVTKRFDTIDAVRSINLDIPDNDWSCWSALQAVARAGRCA